MHYPNGKSFHEHTTLPIVQQRKPSFAQRGMHLEEMLNATNQWYLTHDRAVIHKKPTPVQVVNVHYPKRSHAKIVEAYYRQASTTDYNGIYRGLYIDFEAKQTKQRTRFPLNNFHEHQLVHMERCHHHGGVTFVIIFFSYLQKAYLYPFEALYEDWQLKEKKKTASIPLSRIEDKGYEILYGFQPALRYLDALDTYIEVRNRKK